MVKKYFTVEEANQMIPSITKELIELKNLQSDFDVQLKHLNKLKEMKKEHVQTQTESIFKLESQLEFLEMQAQLHVTNIQNTGAQLKGIDPGLIDFPSVKEDEDILLCWKEGEEEIQHYHSAQEGFAGRKPLDNHQEED
ncbi:DUF2203 domain-containing protein [Salipaludibacillus daqingensis]|uniref:DUF2203 domain-containing protein n=1 Tax=Salipaludibacillus daqingensis TaxID=3041001 RepID=UPI0024756F3D|nr:DUF2203 domain-containing protein [Salipaludibacillus daqingensis]